MELPNIGKHCSEKQCKQLDFLPMKCDACLRIFCGQHVTYDSHNCQESYKKDNHVPVCPMCCSPIPVKLGDTPDTVVGRHIDTDCQSDPAKEKRQVYTNRCCFKGCKQKELVPVICDKCHKNFCLQHRHEQDHKCNGFENTGRAISNSGAAALSRLKFSDNTTAKKSSSRYRATQQSDLSSVVGKSNRSQNSFQGGMSEDEALARAIQLSMSETEQTCTHSPISKSLTQQEQEDLLLAQALYESELEPRNSRQPRSDNKEKSCLVS